MSPLATSFVYLDESPLEGANEARIFGLFGLDAAPGSESSLRAES